MYGGWKSPEMDARKSLNCCEKTVQGDFGKGPERKEASCRESLSVLREYLSNPKQNVGGNMGGKGHSE